MQKLILPLIFLCLGTCLTYGQVNTIEDYKINITTTADGYLDIQETITVNFAKKGRGIYRDIPKHYKVNGKRKKIKVTDVEVKDKNYKLSNPNEYYRIKIGDANKYLTGIHKYELAYQLHNSYLHEDDHIALQYNLITDWDMDIKKMEYNINFHADPELTDGDYLMMTGKRGDDNKHVSLNAANRRLSGKSLTTIPAKDNVTIAVKLPVGYVPQPVSPVSIAAAKKDFTWLLPLLSSLGLFFFYKSSSSEKPHDIYEDEHYPPEGFSPALVGAYHDHKTQTEDVLSLLPYWAEQGIVEILKGEEVLFFKKKSDLPSSSPSYQKTLFNSIFKRGDLVMLNELKEKIAADLSTAKRQISTQIINRDLYDNKNFQLFHSKKFMLIGFIALIAAISCFAMERIFTGISFLIFTIIIFIIHSRTPKLSEQGLILKKHLKGLRRFLENGDPKITSSLVKENPQYFEQLYPFAIALGVDKTWVNKLSELDIPAPQWYGYHGTTNHSRPSLSSFSKEFKIPEISSVFTSVPPNTNRSSGGGFRGGGAGGGVGGGGGAW